MRSFVFFCAIVVFTTGWELRTITPVEPSALPTIFPSGQPTNPSTFGYFANPTGRTSIGPFGSPTAYASVKPSGLPIDLSTPGNPVTKTIYPSVVPSGGPIKISTPSSYQPTVRSSVRPSGSPIELSTSGNPFNPTGRSSVFPFGIPSITSKDPIFKSFVYGRRFRKAKWFSMEPISVRPIEPSTPGNPTGSSISPLFTSRSPVFTSRFPVYTSRAVFPYSTIGNQFSGLPTVTTAQPVRPSIDYTRASQGPVFSSRVPVSGNPFQLSTLTPIKVSVPSNIQAAIQRMKIAAHLRQRQ